MRQGGYSKQFYYNQDLRKDTNYSINIGKKHHQKYAIFGKKIIKNTLYIEAIRKSC